MSMKYSVSIKTNYATRERIISSGGNGEQPHPSFFLESLKRSAPLIASPDKHIEIMMKDRAA